MKRKLSLFIAGLGLCASVMYSSQEATAKYQDVNLTSTMYGFSYLGTFWCPVDGGEVPCQCACSELVDDLPNDRFLEGEFLTSNEKEEFLQAYILINSYPFDNKFNTDTYSEVRKIYDY